jgi:hypothetical protein
MASRPKEQRLKDALQRMADRELGEGAEILDFVVFRVEAGDTITALAQEIAVEMGEAATRGWISWVLNRLTPEAKSRIAAARRGAAMALAEEALAVAEEPTRTTTEVQRNRLRVDTRLNLAKAFDRDTFGERAPRGGFDIGELYVQVLREVAAEASNPAAHPALKPPEADWEYVEPETQHGSAQEPYR